MENQELKKYNSGACDLIDEGKTLVKSTVKYMTAIQVAKPRQLEKCVKNLDVVVNRMPESMFYSWDIKLKNGKKKAVEGGTIGLANAIASMLGNNIIECDVDYEDEDQWRFKAYYIDLETGATNTRLFRQRKNQVEGKYDDERKLDIAFQIGQSKAKRNVIIESNKWLADYALERAKEAFINMNKGDLTKIRNQCLEYFKDQGLTSKILEDKIGKPIDNWDGGDIMLMRGYARAIQEGESRIEDIFSKKNEPAEVDATSLFNGSTAIIEGESDASESAETDEVEFELIKNSLSNADKETVFNKITQATALCNIKKITEAQYAELKGYANIRLKELKGGDDGRKQRGPIKK